MGKFGLFEPEEDLPHAVSYGERHRFRARSSERMRPSRLLSAKRCMDIIGSLCALAVLAVPMLGDRSKLIFLQDFHNPFFLSGSCD